MDPDLDAHCPCLSPAFSLECCLCVLDHFGDELPFVYQCRAHIVGAGPGLRAAAVEVDARDVRRGKGRCSGEFQR
jgi:hypothetical protein